MKNNTKVRLHLSKQLFESLAKQVLAEAKKGDMSGGAYTEAVKISKVKKEKKASEVKATSKMKEEGVEEMETKVAEAPTKKDTEQIKEFELAEPIQQLINDPAIAKEFGMSVLKLLGGGATLAVAVTQGMKALAKKAMNKDPEAFKGKTVDQVAKEMGSSATSKVQKSAGGSGEGGLLGK